MLRTSLRVFSILIAGFAIGGCGGSSGGQVTIQDKQLNRMGKEASSPYATEVQELYIAYFGRPADPAGLANFENALAAAGAPTYIKGLTLAYASNPALQSLIDSFGASKESQTLYGGGGTQDFVSAVFQHVLGRAPQSDGLTYWSNAIDSGALSKGDAALAIMAGALANSTAQGQTDTQLINNRLAVAAAFTAQVASEDVGNYYSGSAAAASARNLLDQVDSTTDLNSFSSTIAATVAQLSGIPGISLLAGNITPEINLEEPEALVRDSSGNLYIVDSARQVIDKMAANGSFSVFVGTMGVSGRSDGVGQSASFYYPGSIAIDGADNLYVADTGNSTIRKITPSGVVSTLAGKPGFAGYSDGVAQTALFNNPQGLAIDAAGNVYVADTSNNTIRKITPDGVVTTIAGKANYCGQNDGAAVAAEFCEPVALAVDADGNIYVVDQAFATIRKISAGGIVSTIAGGAPAVNCWTDGTGAAAGFCVPSGIVIDGAGNLIVSDMSYPSSVNSTIRKVTPDGTVTTIAGVGGTVGFLNGPASSATFYNPAGMAFDRSGNLLVADRYNSSVRELSPGGMVSTFAGLYGVTGSTDGAGAAAGFTAPQGIVADSLGNLYVADGLNDTIRKITAAGVVTTFAGSVQVAFDRDGTGSAASFDQPAGLAIDGTGTIYAVESVTGVLRTVSPAGAVTTLSVKNGNLTGPSALAVDANGNFYVCVSNGVAKISPSGEMLMLAGSNSNGFADGTGGAAEFYAPSGVALDNSGNVYVADTNNNVIRKITQSGVTTTIAGSAGATGLLDGTGKAARFWNPKGLAFDGDGNLYVADSGNNAIRKITPTGSVSTVAGSPGVATTVFGGLPGGISQPQYLTVVGKNTLYVTTAAAVVRIQLP